MYGLIGFPLTHSFSEKYFKEKFTNEGIKFTEYRNFPIEKIDDLPIILNKYPELKGLNVTIPYKESVIPYLNEIVSSAKEIGAVNTIRIEQRADSKHLIGFNTDIDGFESSLLEFWDDRFKKSLVLGSGGASKAVIYVLQKMGVEITVVSRQKKGDNYITYNNLNKSIIQENLLIINTTPTGMYPNTDTFPDIPYDLLSENHFLFDLVYNPDETVFLKRGKSMGALTLNGYQMLVGQADKAWSLWNSK